MKKINPEDISYLTELDKQYSKELKKIANTKEFKVFLERWEYWLDEDTNKLKDWNLIKPFVADCRNEKIVPEEKHGPAIALLMPERIFRVSIKAINFKAPWGCAYKRMKDTGVIDY